MACPVPTEKRCCCVAHRGRFPPERFFQAAGLVGHWGASRLGLTAEGISYKNLEIKLASTDMGMVLRVVGRLSAEAVSL